MEEVPGEIVMAAVMISSRILFLLLRRRDGECSFVVVELWRSCAGASTARLAVGWEVSSSVLGRWSAAGRSGASPRRRRREWPDLEVEDELGAVPRPACHSDRWAPMVLLLVVHKAIPAMELLPPRACWSPSLRFVLLDGAGDERRLDGGAGLSRDFSVISLFLRVFLQMYRSTCLSGPFLPLCTYFVLVSDL